jgi:hypothetical protein
MQVDLKELKRKLICPILDRNSWDYKDSEEKDLIIFLDEAMRWYAKKGRRLSYDILCSIMTQRMVREGKDKVSFLNKQLSLKNILNKGVYSRMSIPVVKADIQIAASNNTILTYELPALANLKTNTVAIIYGCEYKTLEDMWMSYECKLISIWAFYSINRYISIYNIYEDKGKIKELKFRPNQYYIRQAKKDLLDITKTLEHNISYFAPHEICRGCARRDECTKIMGKIIKKK